MFRDMFEIDEKEDKENIDAVKQNILDGTSKWFAKIAITGKRRFTGARDSNK